MNLDELKNIDPSLLQIETVDDDAIFGSTQGSGFNDPPPIQAPAAENKTQPNGNVSMNVGESIPTEIVINGIDIAMSTLGAIGLKMLGYPVTKKQLQLTAKEKDILQAPTEAYLKTINVTLSPAAQFGLVIASVYAAKAMDIVSQGKPAKSSPKNASLEELGGTNQLKKDGRGRPRKS